MKILIIYSRHVCFIIKKKKFLFKLQLIERLLF